MEDGDGEARLNPFVRGALAAASAERLVEVPVPVGRRPVDLCGRDLALPQDADVGEGLQVPRDEEPVERVPVAVELLREGADRTLLAPEVRDHEVLEIPVRHEQGALPPGVVTDLITNKRFRRGLCSQTEFKNHLIHGGRREGRHLPDHSPFLFPSPRPLPEDGGFRF